MDRKTDNPGRQLGPTIRDLYPTQTEQELREADANFRRYLEIVVHIQEEQHAAGTDQFDSAQNLSSMKERSNLSLKN